MSALTQSQAWLDLERHAQAMKGQHLRDLFAADATRGKRFSLTFEGLHLDYSKQRITDETLNFLAALARQQDLAGWRARLFAGERINSSEDRAALHTALRAHAASLPTEGNAPSGILCEVREVRERCRKFTAAARAGTLRGASGKPIRDIVNLGIGGSDQGPRLVADALRDSADNSVRVYFVANADPRDLNDVLRVLSPETTLFIVTTKTFTTLETLHNARRAREWLGPLSTRSHFAAVTANRDAALQFGIDAERIFPVWDWVGGRFSLWSAMGLAAEIAIGSEQFDALLAGAASMDEHFVKAPLLENIPAIMSMLLIFNNNFLGMRTVCVLPYEHRLRYLVPYLQQLAMESNGKRVNRDDEPLDYPTSPIVWGETGTLSQHSFHQLLHQGTQDVPVDFILPLQGGDAASRDMMVKNAIAQAAVLMQGTDGSPPPHAATPGNRPSSMLLIDSLNPRSLGQLLALFEHKTFVEGVLWNINSFDQWGVETGKSMARALASQAAAGAADSSTAALIERARATIAAATPGSS